MIKFVALLLLLAGGFLVAHGRHSTADHLSESDRDRIVESVLYLELQGQASIPEFASIRNVSDKNIEFIDRSWLSKHGFTIVAASELDESKKDHIVEYLLFSEIYYRAGIGVVELSRVREGRPCFSLPFSAHRKYTYEARQTPGGWVAIMIRKRAPMIDFASERSAQPLVGPDRLKRFRFKRGGLSQEFFHIP